MATSFNTYTTSFSFASGACCFDGTYIWSATSNGSGGVLLRVNPASGAITTYQFSPDVGGVGIIFAFGSLWVAAAGTARLWEFSTAGVLLNSYDYTSGALPGSGWTFANLCSDGTSLWVTVAYFNATDVGSVLKIDPSDGSLLHETIVGQDCTDALFDGTSIWTANGYSGAISQVRPSDGVTLQTVVLGDNIEFDYHTQNIAFDGTDLWVLENGNSPFHLYQVSTAGTLLNTFDLTNQLPLALAFAHGNLWVAIDTGGGGFSTLRYALDGSLAETIVTPAGSGVTHNGQQPFAYDGSNLWMGLYSDGANAVFIEYLLGSTIGCACDNTPSLPVDPAWLIIDEPGTGFTDRTEYLFKGEGNENNYHSQVRNRSQATVHLIVRAGDSYQPTRMSPVYEYEQDATGFKKVFVGLIQDIEIRYLGREGDRYIFLNCVSLESVFDTVYAQPTHYKDKSCGFIAKDLICQFECGAPIDLGSSTFQDGPTLGEFNSPLGAKISDLLDQLATTAGFTWYVDIDTQTVFFGDPGTVAAPFTLATDDILWDTVDWKVNGADFRNRQGVKGSFDAFAKSGEFFEGAGQLSVTLKHPVQQVTGAWATLGTCNTAVGTFTGQPAAGDTVTIGTAAGEWQASHAYALGGAIVVNGYVQTVTTAGTSGSSEPTFSTVLGDTTSDGTMIWTCQGPSGLSNGTEVYTFASTIDNSVFGQVLKGATDTDTAQNLFDAINVTESRAGVQLRGVTYSLPTWESSLCNAIDLSGLSFTLQNKGSGSGWIAQISATGTAFSWSGSVTSGGTSPQGSLGPNEGATISLQVYVQGSNTAAPGLAYQVGNPTVSLATPLNVGSNLNVEYTRVGGDTVEVEDSASVAAIATITNGTGKYQGFTDQSQTGLIATSRAGLLGFAQGLLSLYKVPPQRFKFETDRTGLRPGMTQPVLLTGPVGAPAILNGDWFIESIEAKLIPVPSTGPAPYLPGFGHWCYTVSVINVSQITSSSDFWKFLGSGGAGVGGSSAGGAAGPIVATSGGTQSVPAIPDFVGDSGSGGASGAVPAPAAGDAAAGKLLGAGGGWILPVRKYSTSWTAQTSVTVTHNLGTVDVLAQVYDASGIQSLPASLTVVDTNTIALTFGSAFTGSIVVIG